MRKALGLVILTVLAAGGGCGGGSEEKASAGSTPTGTDTAAAGTTESIPEPIVVEGRGLTTRKIEVPEDLAPLVLSARYPQGDLLDVNLRGEGFRRLKGHRGGFLFDGPGSSYTATPGIDRGSYELTVKGTKGDWAITLAEPNPEVAPIELLDALQGEGDTVGKLRLGKAAVLEWEMVTDGLFLQGRLLGYGEAEGAEQFLGIYQNGLILEPGKNGLRTDGTMPAGDYLLIVDADGPWWYEFTRAE